MKVYRLDDFTGIDALRQYDEALAAPQRGEVIVRVSAVSLNYRDIAMMRDRYPMPHRKGLIPTSDGAGRVVAVGEGVTDFRVGDRVMGSFHLRWHGGRRPPMASADGYGSDVDGWLVEHKIVGQNALVRIPDGLSFEEAATLPCAAVTAWTALTGGVPIRAGSTVLTQGSGGVSILAVQLAKALGASVIATTSTAQKAMKLRALGADHVVNYREVPCWGVHARALTSGRGVDCVVEVGGPGTMSQSLRAIAPGGDIAAIGFLDADARNVDFFDLFGSGATFRPISVGSKEALRDVAAAIAMAGILPVIDRVFDFDDAKAAFAYLESGAHFGKVVVRCSSDDPDSTGAR